MKIKIYNIVIFVLSFFFSLSAFSDIPEGAFNTLHIKAKNVDRYVNYIKNNTEVFDLVGSSPFFFHSNSGTDKRVAFFVFFAVFSFDISAFLFLRLFDAAFWQGR